MESIPQYQRYLQQRSRGIQRMAQVQSEIDAWLDRHEAQGPDLAALAHLEALHASRQEASAELQRAESAFLDFIAEYWRAPQKG